jgi:hypothetical protein
MSITYKKIEFGYFSSVNLSFDFDGICDTKVFINDVYICTISAHDIDNFTNELSNLLEKMHI